MNVFTPSTRDFLPIREFQSVGARSIELAAGTGESHVHLVQIDAGGEIGPHVTGFDQIFFCLDGAGWVASRPTRDDCGDGTEAPVTINARRVYRYGPPAVPVVRPW